MFLRLPLPRVRVRVPRKEQCLEQGRRCLCLPPAGGCCVGCWLTFYSLQLSGGGVGVRGGPRALSFHVTPPPGLSVSSLLMNCQPAFLGNSVPLLTLFLLQRSSHLSWSTRRRSRASSPDTPISPFRCLVLMAATTICSADAKLAEGTDPRGGARPTRLCVLCPADYIQGLCASPTLPPIP